MSSGARVNLGTVLNQRYQIVRPLAKGGMAHIYEGRDGSQRVVIKVLKEGLSKDPVIVERFHREVRAASALNDPHVVRILGFGTTEDERPYLVMEFLFGNDLAKELQKRRVLPLEEAATYMAQTCQAMIRAHDAGVIHRDLKPTNLYLADEGKKRVLKVLDFGIAKVTGNSSAEQITRPTALIGSPPYMSPETFAGASNADVRSDIWSVGVIFYELITGVQPFRGESAARVAMAITRDEQIDPSQVLAGLPRSVDVVIGRALKKRPDDRYQTMRELLAALEVYLPRGRNDTMEIRLASTPGQDDDPRTFKQDAAAYLGLIEATRTSTPDSTLSPVAVPVAASDDDALDGPTRVRVGGAAAALAALQIKPAVPAPIDEPSTLVQPVPSELSGAHAIDAPAAPSPIPPSTAAPARGSQPSHEQLAPAGESPLAPIQGKSSKLVWAVPAVALAAGLGGWWIGRADAPPPAAQVTAAVAASPATESPATPPPLVVVSATADAVPAAPSSAAVEPPPPEASATASGSGSPSATAESTAPVTKPKGKGKGTPKPKDSGFRPKAI